MASINRRPDGTWRARYRSPDGKEHAKHTETKAVAQRWLDEQTAKIVTGHYVDPKAGRTTLRAYSETWLTRMRPTWRPATDAAVTNTLDKHVLPVLEPGQLVLLGPDGQPVASGPFGHQWRRAVKAAGATGLRYHDLRHTYASTLLSRGVSVKAVADWLGHASPVVTLTTYAHLMPADDDVARGVLDAAFTETADSSRTSEAGNA